MNGNWNINGLLAGRIINKIDVVLVVVDRGAIIIPANATKISPAPLATLFGLYLHPLTEQLQSYMHSRRFTGETPINLRDLFEGIEAGHDGVEALRGRDIVFLAAGEEVDVVGKTTLGSEVTDALFDKGD